MDGPSTPRTRPASPLDASSASNHSNDQKKADRNSAAAVSAALDDGKKHLLLAASGSVATIKLPLILSSLSQYKAGLSIRVILTESATRFLAGQSDEQPSVASLAALPHVEAVYRDADEWAAPWKRDGGILHIELRRWAHLLVVAPLSANTLAKVANGLADNLLTSVIRAWDVGRRARIVVAPAMNSAMWAHPVTAKQVRVLEDEWGVDGADPERGWFEVLRPQAKTLACGDFGQGGMQDWQEIVSVIEKRMDLGAIPRKMLDDYMTQEYLAGNTMLEMNRA